MIINKKNNEENYTCIKKLINILGKIQIDYEVNMQKFTNII